MPHLGDGTTAPWASECSPGGCDERQEQSFAFFTQLYFGVFSLEQLPVYLDQYIMWDDKCPHGFNHPALFLEARGLLLSDLAFLLGTRWGLGLDSDLRRWWITVFLFGGLPPQLSLTHHLGSILLWPLAQESGCSLPHSPDHP